MKLSTNPVLSTARRRPLAACIATLFALAAHDALAAIAINCIDHGPGSLRDAVAVAASGDTIDMTGMTCPNSTLTLTTGAIVVNQPSLTLLGPGANALAIKGGPGGTTRDYSVVDHQGSGTLTVQNLRLTGGSGHLSATYNGVLGGCVYSRGSVVLNHARVDNCSISDFTNSATLAAGGGVLTLKNLLLVNSVIDGNYVGSMPSSSVTSVGGGAYVVGNFTAKYSTISGNQAGFSTVLGKGGGVFVSGNASVSNSTVYANTANYSAGGLHVNGIGKTLTIASSTISGNTAPQRAGVFSYAGTNTIYNSTIASNYNSAVTGNAAGIVFDAQFGSMTVNLHSTLIANNAYVKGSNRVNDDIGVNTVTNSNTVTFATDAQQGNFNLVRALDATISANSLPPDTIIGKCPLLGKMKDNGGPTWTMALYSGSPAIDAGVNSQGLAYDQRGGPIPVPSPIPPPPLAYDRHSGLRTDIGAFEVQQTDVIFNAGFESCP